MLSKDGRKELSGALIASCVVVCASILFGLTFLPGCDRHEVATTTTELINENDTLRDTLRVEATCTRDALAEIKKLTEQQHQPTQAPIDYSPLLTSIDASLKGIAEKSEHSVIVPTGDEKRLTALEKELADLKKNQCKCHCK